MTKPREPRRAPPTAGGLSERVRDAVEQYLDELEGEAVTDLYDTVLREVEVPLLEVVLRRTGNNQSRAAALLGLNRGTLRARLRRYAMQSLERG